MPILRRVLPELLLLLVGTAGALFALLLPSPWWIGVARAPSPYDTTLTMQNLLDHIAAISMGFYGYPSDFTPLHRTMMAAQLLYGPTNWTCVASLDAATLAPWLDLPAGGLKGNVVDLEQLAERVAPRYLHRSGDFIYIPIASAVAPSLTGEGTEAYYRNCILVAYDYPENKQRPVALGFPRKFEDFPTIDAVRVGPFVALRQKQPLPERVSRYYQVDPTTQIWMQQQGSSIRIQMQPSPAMPQAPVQFVQPTMHSPFSITPSPRPH